MHIRIQANQRTVAAATPVLGRLRIRMMFRTDKLIIMQHLVICTYQNLSSTLTKLYHRLPIRRKALDCGDSRRDRCQDNITEFHF